MISELCVEMSTDRNNSGMHVLLLVMTLIRCLLIYINKVLISYICDLSLAHPAAGSKT